MTDAVAVIPAAIWTVVAMGAVVVDRVTVWHLIGGIAAIVHLLREGSR